MKRTHSPVVLFGLAAFLTIGFAGAAFAANPSNISVTVMIEYLSVSTTGPIDFGVVAVGSATVAAGASVVTNDGNVDEDYSLSLTDPAGWTAVQAVPGNEEYCLSAMFNSVQPASGSYTYVDHALSTASTLCTATQFAGDDTGVSVPVSAAKNLWFKFEAPSATAVTTQQTITVTVTASAA